MSFVGIWVFKFCHHLIFFFFFTIWVRLSRDSFCQINIFSWPKKIWRKKMSLKKKFEENIFWLNKTVWGKHFFGEISFFGSKSILPVKNVFLLFVGEKKLFLGKKFFGEQVFFLLKRLFWLIKSGFGKKKIGENF